MLKYFVFVVSAILALPSLRSFAQSPADARPSFIALADSTRLEDSALKPWHLKISFDQKATNVHPAESGVIEEWWAAPDKYRISLTSFLYEGTTTRDGSSIARTKGIERLPAVYQDLLEMFTHPLPSAERIEKSSATPIKRSVGKAELDCFVLGIQSSAASKLYFGTAPTFCAAPGAAGVNVVYRWRDQVLIMGKQVRFQGKVVPKELDIFTSGTAETHAQLDSLSTFVPSSSEFVPSSDQTEVQDPIQEGPYGLPPNPLKKVTPQYPDSARNAHLEGTVVLDAVIAEDGHIESLSVMHSIDAELSRAAIAAVRQWRYTPQIQGGRPVKVDIPVTVNFNVTR